ncbi:MAG: cupin domain-containing protein [Gemmatimonadota bacterium]|nr:MAG: cupin domain-containing protein [Gemmatimonadota bacterium]
MNRTSWAGLIVLALACVASLIPSACGSPEESGARPSARVIVLDSGGEEYQPVLGGPPESLGMRSGLVTLAPDSSIGQHNTEAYEELIIVFEGQGELRLTGAEILPLEPGVAAYCPPNTQHDVVNTGSETLQYLYVVAPASNRGDA